MRKYIAFDVFKPGQNLHLTIGRLADVEALLGKGIGDVLRLNNNLNLTFLAAFLSVGLRDDNGNKPMAYYFQAIEKALEEGHTIQEIQEPVFNAIVSTGILGKKLYLEVFPEKKTEKLEKEAEKEEKN